MHERSLVRAIIKQVIVESHARRLGRIHEIRLQIGEFSGVEPRLIESAFEEMASEFWDTEIRLTVDVVPLTANCRTCHVEFPIESFRFVCPACAGGDVKITAGEEVRIVSLTAEPVEVC